MLRIIKKYKYIITFILFLVIIFFIFFRSKNLKENNKEYSIYKSDDILIEDTYDNDKKEKIKVDIKGEVANPGVYELEIGSRVIDAINVAGGFTDKANTNYINLSKLVEDEMVIIIYSNEEVKKSDIIVDELEQKLELENDTNNLESKKLININTSSLEKLMTLSGIGETKAKAIIEYREKSKFKTIEEIKNVRGIGEALFNKIKEYITV